MRRGSACRAAHTPALRSETADGAPLDQDAALALYDALRVPGVHSSTAAVGNAQWKQAVGLMRLGDSGLRCSARLLAAHFAGGDDGAVDALWERLKRDMRAGVRVLYHCSNHYVRVFGFREGWQPESSLAPVAAESAVPAGGDSGDEAAGAGAAAPAATGLSAVRRLNAVVGELLAPRVASGALWRREVLTARRGQRPKHWVAWEQVAADISGHKLHRLFAVRVVGGRGRRPAPPLLDQGAS